MIETLANADQYLLCRSIKLAIQGDEFLLEQCLALLEQGKPLFYEDFPLLK
jgi:hypothetical protein